MALLQMTSVGKNCPHNKQPHHMERSAVGVVTVGWQHPQSWIEGKASNPPVMLPLSFRRRVMRLFGKARSIHRGQSWKIPLSFHPTQTECVFTQPPCDPEQGGPDRWIHLRQRGLCSNRKKNRKPTLSQPVWVRPSLSLSLRYDPLRQRRCQTQRVRFRLSHQPRSFLGVCVYMHRWVLSDSVSHCLF